MARLGVWIVAITGVLIVVTLMTNTTDKFIDLLNGSIFKAIGINTRIEKVPSVTNGAPVVIPGLSKDTNLKSNATDETTNSTDTLAPETAADTVTDNTATDTSSEVPPVRTRRTHLTTTTNTSDTTTPEEQTQATQ